MHPLPNVDPVFVWLSFYHNDQAYVKNVDLSGCFYLDRSI